MDGWVLREPLAKTRASKTHDDETISSEGYITLPYSGLNQVVGAGLMPACVSSMNFARGSFGTARDAFIGALQAFPDLTSVEVTDSASVVNHATE